MITKPVGLIGVFLMGLLVFSIAGNSLMAQSVWTGSAGVGPDRWNRPGNWNNFLPPVTPLQDALFGDIAGTTNVRVASFGGGSTTVLPDDLRFTNVLDDYTITIPNGSSLRPISVTLNGSGNVTFTSLGSGTFHAQIGNLWELEIVGSGSSLFTVNSVISDGVLPTILIHDREAGTTVLNGANTYSGGTELQDGLLVLGNDAALGTGELRIFGGVLSNDGNARDVTVPAVMTGNFTGRDTGAGVGLYFLDEFELGSGDLQVTLSGTSGLLCFEGVLSGAADSFTFTLEAGTTDFVASLCGPDSNTFAGLVIVDDGVILELDKDPGAVAIAGDMEIRTGATVVSLSGGQFANTSNVLVNGDLILDLLPFPASEQLASITGNGSIYAGLATASLSVNSGNFSGVISDGTDGGQLSLSKTANGTLTLTGNNTYTGSTSVTGGMLLIRDGGALSGTNDISVAHSGNGTAEFRVEGATTDFTANATVTVGGGSPGNLGAGRMVITDGSKLSNTGVGFVGFGFVNGTGAGEVLVSEGGFWDILGASLDIGLYSDGAVTISSGGRISVLQPTGDPMQPFNGITSLSGFGTVPASLLITGTGSQFNTFQLSSLANSTITVEDGGYLQVTGDARILTTNPGQISSAFVRSNGLFEVGKLFLGDSGTGNLTVSGNGTVRVDGGNGTVILGEDQFNLGGAQGNLIIGEGGAAGFLEAAEVTTGNGSGQVIFNHTDDAYAFLPLMSGNLSVLHSGNGTTVLSQANTYTGGTTIVVGTLRTNNVSALGSGPAALNGGVLEPIGPLGFSDLTWSNGNVSLDLDGGSRLDLANAFTNGGNGGTFVFGNGTQDTTYRLVNFVTTNFSENQFAATTNIQNVILNGVFVLDDINGFLDFTLLGASATGAILQNSNPVNIPTFADFTVNGTVSTGAPNESNTINSLIFNPDSSLQVFNNLTVASGTFNVPGGSASLFGGNVITPGDFNKLGAGNLISNSNFQVGGAANIQGGGLIVNGQFTAPGGLTVFQNALLGGSGIINANVFNSGTVAPGNSPGTLTINGNFSQASGGTLQIEIASPTVFDRLIVSGSANLAGTLQVLNLGKNLKYGQQYAFLQAGSINGEFDQILMPNPSRFRGRFLTNGGLGSLVVAPTSYTLVAETPNQRRVAKALDSYIPARGNDRETVSIALDVQTEEQYPAAFNQIAPSFHESIANISIEQAFAQTQLLNQRMSSVRLGSRGFQAIGLDPEPLTHDKDGKSVADPKDFKSQISNLQSPAWAIWAQGNGMFAKVTNVSQVPNYRYNSGGFLFGADYTFGEPKNAGSTLSTGLFAGYQGTYADYNSAGRTSINSALFGAYATYTQGGFYADAVVAGGYNNYNVRRSIEFSTVDRSARSTQNGGQFSAALNFGYDWEIGKFTLGPIAGLQYTYVGIAPFTENGAESLDLRVGQQNANSMRSTLGGRIAYTWTVSESLVIIPEVRMFWLHEFLNNPRVIGAALDGGSGESFGYLTSTPDRDSVFAGAGFSTQFGPNWYASAFWNIDFGRQDFLNHIISANLGMKF